MIVKDVYFGSLLSEASYADLSEITNEKSYVDALTAEDFSPIQAAEIVSHWRVANHIPNTSTGFSATVFESKDNPDEYTLAIRGTEPSVQWRPI